MSFILAIVLATVTPAPQGAGSSVVSNVSAVVRTDATERVPPEQNIKPSVGWPESGEIPLSFVSARKKLAVKLAKKGWCHVHTINLGKDRKLESWDRGGEELTLMVWRMGTGRTGYSLGITKKDGK